MFDLQVRRAVLHAVEEVDERTSVTVELRLRIPFAKAIIGRDVGCPDSVLVDLLHQALEDLYSVANGGHLSIDKLPEVINDVVGRERGHLGVNDGLLERELCGGSTSEQDQGLPRSSCRC